MHGQKKCGVLSEVQENIFASLLRVPYPECGGASLKMKWTAYARAKGAARPKTSGKKA